MSISHELKSIFTHNSNSAESAQARPTRLDGCRPFHSATEGVATCQCFSVQFELSGSPDSVTKRFAT
ncbi:hypothetical protein J6590_034473 [Homalodisca vitripennis]|nr:hypothetical protein J6590_034473 [Homalodisca vitripennis]